MIQSSILPPSSRLKKHEDGDDRFLLQHWYLSTKLHGIRSHKTFILLQSYFPKHQKWEQTEQLHCALLINSGAQPLWNFNGTSHPKSPEKGSSFPTISFPSYGGKYTGAQKRAIFHPTILTGPDWAPFLYTLPCVWMHVPQTSVTTYIDHTVSHPRSSRICTTTLATDTITSVTEVCTQLSRPSVTSDKWHIRISDAAVWRVPRHDRLLQQASSVA
jgi:hypothetical protein